MRLYVAGVDLPKFGTIKDRVLRKFAMYELEREVTVNKIHAQIALRLSDNNEKGKEVLKTWNKYVNLTYGIEDLKIQEEIDMQAEYEQYKNLSPVLCMGKDGSLTVKGLK